MSSKNLQVNFFIFLMSVYVETKNHIGEASLFSVIRLIVGLFNKKGYV